MNDPKVHQVTNGNGEYIAMIAESDYLDLQKRLESAIDYIRECPCDPDIFPSQWLAWDRFITLNPDYDEKKNG